MICARNKARLCALAAMGGLVTVCAFAQAAGPQASIRRVAVLGGSQALELEVTASQSVAPPVRAKSADHTCCARPESAAALPAFSIGEERDRQGRRWSKRTADGADAPPNNFSRDCSPGSYNYSRLTRAD